MSQDTLSTSLCNACQHPQSILLPSPSERGKGGEAFLMCTFSIDILVLIDTLILLGLSDKLVKSASAAFFEFTFVDQLAVVLCPIDQVTLFGIILGRAPFVVVQKIHIHLPHHHPSLLMRHHTAFVL